MTDNPQNTRYANIRHTERLKSFLNESSIILTSSNPSQLVKWEHNIVWCALNVQALIWNNFMNSVSNKGSQYLF